MKYKDIHITWRGDVTSYSGTGQYARALLKPLILGGASVRLEMQPPHKPECEVEPWWAEQFQLLSKNSPGDLTIVCGPIDRVNLSHGNKTVLFTHWECKDVPTNAKVIIGKEEVIEVIVPSQEMCAMGIEQLDKPVDYVHMPIDIDSLNKVTPLSINGIDDSTILFGAMGEWNNRNNLSDTVVAYLKAFTDKDNVALVLKTFANNAQDLNERQKLLGLIRKIKEDCKRPNLPRIVILQEVMGYSTIDSLIKRINIFVCSSRGESKNYSLMRALGMGKQAIICDHTANATLCKKDTSNIYRVPYIYEPIILDKGMYNISDTWARVDCETLSTLMRDSMVDLLQKGAEMKDEGKKVKAYLRTEYSADKCADKLATIIRRHAIVPLVQL